MKHTNQPTQPPPANSGPSRLKRQADPSLFANPNGDSGLLLHFEDPKLLAFVRQAVAEKLQPATQSDAIFAELAVRHIWRAIRSGTIETAAFDVEMGERDPAIQAAWGNIDPVARCHLSIRDPQTRQTIHFYSRCEMESIRAFKQSAALAKSK